MRTDVVITTHRDLVALAPQPLYLARALSDRGIRVELVSNAPAALRKRLGTSNLRLSGPLDSLTSPRLRLIAIWLTSISKLLSAKIGVAFDLEAVLPLAIAGRFRSFLRVLYWLEPFYVDYTAQVRFSTIFKRRMLAALLPPEALIDVDYRRLEISRKLCREPSSSFVLRNAPPSTFASHRNSRTFCNVISLVYSGSATGLGAEGIEHMVKAVAITRISCTLTIFPAEGKSVAQHLAEMIREHDAEEKVVLKDRIDRGRLGETLAEYDIGIVLYPVWSGQNANSLMAAPNKLYEYLASGLAVLASNNETMQFVSKEGLGWNINGVSPKETAKFLNCLRRADVEACCQRAALAFRERYNYESQAEPVLEWFVQQLVTVAEPAGRSSVVQP